MKKLLLATDLSPRSDRALERSLSLARERGADLTILHVVEDDLPAQLAEAQKQAAEAAIRAQIESLSAGQGPSISTSILSGRAHSEILEQAEALEADLVVLGVHRKDVLKDMFRGTTAERVIRTGNLPSLVVKDRVDGPYRRIMVGVDFSVYSRRAIEFAVAFAPKADFHLVHAYDVPFKGFLYGRDTQKALGEQHGAQFEHMIDKEMARFLAGAEVDPRKLERIMEEGLVRDVLHRQLSRLQPDLLVIGTHGRTGVAHAVLGSVAEDLLSDPPCDVLAVKAW